MMITLPRHTNSVCFLNTKSNALNYVCYLRPAAARVKLNARVNGKSSSRSVTSKSNSVPIDGILDKDYDNNICATAKNRRAGILLHPTSLPGPYGIGEIGQNAKLFLDWLHTTGCTIWQVLPLVPPERQHWSPYSGLDALCNNTLLIDLQDLIKDGLIHAKDLPEETPVTKCNFVKVEETKDPILRKAAKNLLNMPGSSLLRKELENFRNTESWVEDSALFHCLAYLNDNTKDKNWWEWPPALRRREKEALAQEVQKWKLEIDILVAQQFLFDRQWKQLKAYANSLGIKIMGDMPIYVSGQSADVWCYPHLFQLTESGAPKYVSGVPPDAFTSTGQLWGSPLYNWKACSLDNYSWWRRRLARSLQLFDETRIDHFRGFAGMICLAVYNNPLKVVFHMLCYHVAYWSVDAREETAMNGKWRKGPGKDFFDALGNLPIVAEDLGVITEDVDDLRKDISAPGMIVLQFAWDGKNTNNYLPHNHYENSVCYAGTHDNDTVLGWWESTSLQNRKQVMDYFNASSEDNISWLFIRKAFESVSKTSIVTIQDVLCLDNSARMNFPGTVGKNWAWRVGDASIWSSLKKEATSMRALLKMYDRLPREEAESDV